MWRFVLCVQNLFLNFFKCRSCQINFVHINWHTGRNTGKHVTGSADRLLTGFKPKWNIKESEIHTYTQIHKDKTRKYEFECKHKEYVWCTFSRIFWDAGDDNPAIRRKPVAWAKTSIASTTDRKVMKLQDYVKYLVCIFVVNFGTTFCNKSIIISSLRSVSLSILILLHQILL